MQSLREESGAEQPETRTTRRTSSSLTCGILDRPATKAEIDRAFLEEERGGYVPFDRVLELLATKQASDAGLN